MIRRALSDSRVAALLLALCTLLIHLPATWSLPLIDRDEPRFAEASREMRQRGDYVVPYFNNELRLDKPPLIYWAQAASFALFGETEFAARLPTVIATTLTALVIFGFGTRLYGRHAGVMAALAFVLCLQVALQGKAATADLSMVLFVTLACWAGWELISPSPALSPPPLRRCWWWIFYCALALGFLAKGPVAWLPLGTVLLFCTRQQSGAARLRALSLPCGILLTLAIVACWGVPALLRTDGEFFRVGIGQHVIGRAFFQPMEGHGARTLLEYLGLLPFYFVTLFASFLPWSLFLPGMFRHFRVAAHRCAAERFLIGGVLLTFGIFTPLATKLPHYTLPAFPLLAILLAGWLRGRSWPVKLLLGTSVLHLAAGFILAPWCADLFPVRRLTRSAAPWLQPATELASVSFPEPSLVWYFRGSIATWPRAIRAEEVAPFLSAAGPRACVLPSDLAAQLRPAAPPLREWTARGINPTNGRLVTLVLWVKEYRE